MSEPRGLTTIGSPRQSEVPSGYDQSMTDLRLRCGCGTIQGIVRRVGPGTVNRVVCHCRGCTAYAHQLGAPETILDARGGTDVVHVSPRTVIFEAGLEHVACMRLTERGALRFYARCCRTPIAHTLPSLRIPFMAINHACIDWTAAAGPRERLVGPIRARVNGRFARQDARRLRATISALLSMLLHYAPRITWWWLRGDARHSPLRDLRTGRPIVEPQRVESMMLTSNADGPKASLARRSPRPARGCG